MQRRRSRRWWGVFCFAFLATGAYIAFDVLDLDGSDLRGRLAGGPAVAEPAGTEAEARLRQDHPTPETVLPAFAVPAFRLAATDHPAAPRGAATAILARRGRFPARAPMARGATCSDSSPADPA